MWYSQQIKQRAIQLDRELPMREVLMSLDREFPNALSLPTERTIRRWRPAEPTIHTEHETNQIHPSAPTNWKEHNEKLAGVANKLLANNLIRVMKWVISTGQVEYQLFDESEEYILSRFTEDDLSGLFEQNITLVYQAYTEWFYKTCFIPHLFAELTEETRMKWEKSLLYEQPYELIETLRLLAARKTFKGTCPVCKDW